MPLDKIVNRVSNLTLYDLKSMFRKAQNVVFNYNEMEAKVREVTNNEPWGASTTLMQEIAVGTYNYTTFNEIMPMIYKRFTEKTAEQWRQIYKALQLLEFLVKNGSERVVDDVRSHISIIKILRNFHYIDNENKDRGINVSNKAKELINLLSDTDLLKQERKKAKINKERYTGIGSNDSKYKGSNLGEYNGFGNGKTSSSYNEYNVAYYNDQKFNNEIKDTNTDNDSISRTSVLNFEEYNEFDDVYYKSYVQQKNNSIQSNSKISTINTVNTTTDLFPFINDSFNSNEFESHKNNFFEPSQNLLDSNNDDKFDEFQSAEQPFEYEIIGLEHVDSMLSSQMSTDLSLASKKNFTQLNQLTDQSLDKCFMESQSKSDDCIINFTNFDNTSHTEKSQNNVSKPISSKFSETQSQDLFSKLWATALNKDTDKLSIKESKLSTTTIP